MNFIKLKDHSKEIYINFDNVIQLYWSLDQTIIQCVGNTTLWCDDTPEEIMKKL